MQGLDDKVLADILERAVGPDRAPSALAALHTPPSVSIRLNPFKILDSSQQSVENDRPEQPSGLGDTQPQRSEDGLRRAGAAGRTPYEQPALPAVV